jgi:penicillin-insensitive murein endopeptidase
MGQLAAPRPWAVAFAALLAAAGGASAAPAVKNPWALLTAPSVGAARAIGDYSAGCVQGAVALPLDGPGYQVMHPARLRYFGHPTLVDFVQQLGKHMHDAGHGPLLIGDLAQPRGGRASGGHASHQSGLDVDIWYWHPPAAKHAALNDAQRESVSARSILDPKLDGMQPRWSVAVGAMLHLAADDPRVERIFVHPRIKRELCASAGDDRAWLKKVRPWHGHDDHFHARLACPADSTECEAQAPVPNGDGCAELAWWFDAAAQADRDKARDTYQDKVVNGRRWPEACDALLQ